MRTEWIEGRLQEAVSCLARLPDTDRVRLTGTKTSWPDVVHDAIQSYGYSDAKARPGGPGPGEIDRMDEALSWLTMIDDYRTRKTVWMRVAGAPWYKIASRWHRSERTAQNWYKRGLSAIKDELDSALA